MLCHVVSFLCAYFTLNTHLNLVTEATVQEGNNKLDKYQNIPFVLISFVFWICFFFVF